MSAQVQLFGVKELNDFFMSMKRSDQKKVIIESWHIGSRSVIVTARALLKRRIKSKSRTKNLEKSLGFVAGRGKTIITAKIGARRFGEYKGYHGHLFDAGTTSRTTKAGYSRGEMPATNFFTDTVNQKSEQLITDTQKNIVTSLNKEISKKLAKTKKITYKQFLENRKGAGW